MNPLVDVERAYALCRHLTETRGPNFSVGFRFLPPPKRMAVYASYAFCRLIDDVADEGTGGRDALEAAMGRWEDELVRVYAGRPRHTVGHALYDALRLFPIPQDAFAGLIRGCRHDLEGRRYVSYDELVGYCELVAVTIGRISLAIFGALDDAAHALGRDLSVALQLTNILRDVGEDARQGRVYLPLGELEMAGVNERALRSGQASSGFAEVMDRNIARARTLFARADALVEHLEEDARLPTRLMGALYVEVLDRIARRPGRVLTERVGLSAHEKAELVRRHLEGKPTSWAAAG